MKSRILPVLVLFFCCAGLLFSLDKGTLTINNCPAEVSVYVGKNNTSVTLLKLADLILDDSTVVGLGGSSPFTLRTKSADDFTATGNFMVIVIDRSIADNPVFYFLKSVKFNNGSATIDFKKMQTVSLGL